MSAQERIEKLEKLLARIQRNAGAPRAQARASASASVPVPVPVPAPAHAPAPAPISDRPPRDVEPAVDSPPVEELRRTASMFDEPKPQPEGPPPMVVPEVPEPPAMDLAPEPSPEVAATSGEFAVAEMSDMPMELEVLGDADEVGAEDSIVEVDMSEIELVPEVRRTEPIMARSGPPPEPEPEPEPEGEAELHSEPPASGRELVATPHESARLKVAAPAVAEEEISLEPVQPPPAPALPSPPPPLPEPSLKEAVTLDPVPVIAPDRPATDEPPATRPSVVPEVRPSTRPAPIAVTPMPIAPVAPVAPLAPPGPPEQVAAAVALAAPGAQARPVQPIEQVVVSLEAAVIRPGITPADVGAIVGAARTLKPENFGALLDAALDL